jgi:hypothetical protein
MRATRLKARELPGRRRDVNQAAAENRRSRPETRKNPPWGGFFAILLGKACA